jgi:hypothetical protein
LAEIRCAANESLADTGRGRVAVRREGGAVLSQELNVLALLKGEERYVYVYDDDSRATLLEAFQAHAADTELSLNWFDAAVLAQKAREQTASLPPAPAARTPKPTPRF